MRENRPSGSEGGAGSNIPVPTPIDATKPTPEPTHARQHGEVPINYAEGVASFSPGLRGTSYSGSPATPYTPQGFHPWFAP